VLNEPNQWLRRQNLFSFILSGYKYTDIRNHMTNGAYIRSLSQILAFAALWAPMVTSVAAAAEVIPAFDASYSVRYGILRGKMTLRLSHHDAGYLYETSLSPRGMVSWIRSGTIVERTVLETTNGTIRPLDYVSTDTIARPPRNTSYFFDRETGRVTGQYKTQLIDLPMRPGGHNRISGQVAIMLALKTGSNFSQFSIFDRGRWKDYEFKISGEKLVDTPSGSFDALEIRYASSDGAKSWSLYCAPSLNYMPVMIVYRENGKTKSRAELTEFRIDNAE